MIFGPKTVQTTNKWCKTATSTPSGPPDMHISLTRLSFNVFIIIVVVYVMNEARNFDFLDSFQKRE